MTGPHFVDMDFTLVKITGLTERKNLEFRAEFFNLLNHANFSVPVRTVFTSSRIHSGNEGAILSTATLNRDIQLGMKLIF